MHRQHEDKLYKYYYRVEKVLYSKPARTFYENRYRFTDAKNGSFPFVLFRKKKIKIIIRVITPKELFISRLLVPIRFYLWGEKKNNPNRKRPHLRKPLILIRA